MATNALVWEVQIMSRSASRKLTIIICQFICFSVQIAKQGFCENEAQLTGFGSGGNYKADATKYILHIITSLVFYLLTYFLAES
jgi:hypothetical protein